jgi:hypothetical protein
MRAEEIKGLMEAYSHVYETPEVLSEEVVEEDVEQLMERGAPTDPKARAAYDAQVAKNRAALGNTLLYGNAAGKKPEAPVTRNRNVRGGGTIKPPTDAPAKKPMANIPPSEGTGRGGPSDIAKKPAPAPAAKPAPAPAAKPAASAAPKPSAPAKPAPGTKAAGPESIKPKTPNPLLKDKSIERMQQASQMRQKGANVTSDMISDKSVKAPAPKPQMSARAQALKAGGPAGGARERMLNQGVDIFDLVKGHLLDEGYADSEEGAMVIMVNMSEEWRKSILEAHGVELDEAQEAREKPEKHEEKEEKENEKKYGHVRGEKTPMPPRGDKRREEFEKWYAKQMGR